MNVDSALEKLLYALTEAPRALRGILADWEQLDDDLREHYSLDTEWLLTTVRRQIGDLRTTGKHDVWRRVNHARTELAQIGDEIERTMGFRPESLLLPSPEENVAVSTQETRTESRVTATVLVEALRDDTWRDLFSRNASANTEDTVASQGAESRRIKNAAVPLILTGTA